MTPSERYPRRVLVVGSASTGRVVRAAQDHRVRALDLTRAKLVTPWQAAQQFFGAAGDGGFGGEGVPVDLDGH